MPAPIRDSLSLIARDILAGFGLLTRIPAPFIKPRPAGVWAWPFIGLVTAGIALSLGAAVQMAGAAVGIAAALTIAAQVALTGGLHEDGLADCADGFWGGQNRGRRLEIMKDSRIGSYGGIALALMLLMRWSALEALFGAGAYGLALAPAILSRAAMGLVMAIVPNARQGGLSAGHGRPPLAVAGLGALVALLLALAVAGWAAALALALAAGLLAAGFALLARVKIGGQTGDVLGAVQVLTEIGALAVATALLP